MQLLYALTNLKLPYFDFPYSFLDSNACLDGLHHCKSNEFCIPLLDGLDYECHPKSGDTPCPPGYKPTSNNQICEGKNKFRVSEVWCG